MRIELVPAIAGLELARIFGWRNPVGRTFSFHQDSWGLWLASETPAQGRLTELPMFGIWNVRSTLDGQPTGDELPAAGGCPLGGLYHLGPTDLVRKISFD